jgi:hypothetical protein
MGTPDLATAEQLRLQIGPYRVRAILKILMMDAGFGSSQLDLKATRFMREWILAVLGKVVDGACGVMDEDERI